MICSWWMITNMQRFSQSNFAQKIFQMDKSQVGRFHHSRTAVRRADYHYWVKKVVWSKCWSIQEELLIKVAKRNLDQSRTKRGEAECQHWLEWSNITAGRSHLLPEIEMWEENFLGKQWGNFPRNKTGKFSQENKENQPHGSICFISGRNLSQWVTKLSWDLSTETNIVAFRLFEDNRYLLEHLLEVLKDGLLEVLTLLDVKGLKFFPDYPGDLFKVLLGHINLELNAKYKYRWTDSQFKSNVMEIIVQPVSHFLQSPVSKYSLYPACLQVQLSPVMKLNRSHR